MPYAQRHNLCDFQRSATNAFQYASRIGNPCKCCIAHVNANHELNKQKDYVCSMVISYLPGHISMSAALLKASCTCFIHARFLNNFSKENYLREYIYVFRRVSKYKPSYINRN